MDKALKMNPEFKKLYQEDEQVKELIDMSRTSGRSSETYIHACGRCRDQSEADRGISCRFHLGSDGSVTTQFTMTHLEELGLLKMDFLGLRT